MTACSPLSAKRGTLVAIGRDPSSVFARDAMQNRAFAWFVAASGTQPVCAASSAHRSTVRKKNCLVPVHVAPASRKDVVAPVHFTGNRVRWVVARDEPRSPLAQLVEARGRRARRRDRGDQREARGGVGRRGRELVRDVVCRDVDGGRRRSIAPPTRCELPCCVGQIEATRGERAVVARVQRFAERRANDARDRRVRGEVFEGTHNTERGVFPRRVYESARGDRSLDRRWNARRRRSARQIAHSTELHTKSSVERARALGVAVVPKRQVELNRPARARGLLDEHRSGRGGRDELGR